MSNLISVAKLAGVSRATAARAFSNPTLLRQETLLKVITASKQLGFRPNRIAQQLRTQSTQIIGVVIPTLSNPVFAEQLQAMESVAKQYGYSLLVATTDYQPTQEAYVIENMLRQRVDGLVLTVADADNSAVLDALQREDVPVVLVHNQPQEKKIPSVCVDNYRAIYDATRHLHLLGHRHIGMIAGPMWQSDRARLRFGGYCQAMHVHGLTALPLIEMPKHTASSFITLEPYLHGANALTALICSNDLLAISTIGSLMRAGFQVPQQISVVGFDGINLGQYLFPALCSVVQPCEDLGRCAVESLMTLLAGQPLSLGTLRHYFRPGESIGSPPTE
ncbi:substrate-binding domain-containing protein [Yersinia intermedia]|uniref:substrate-binding domain-containing protein n=1 Tax=Yersinia intermedia TaxID=631 RepID=UPI0022438BE9|nr:substrate-binding domain-containing protein [Yersinia intermedia]MCW8114078.1 substrate-binding domain-containing protein [Yersinia intermedia]MDA5518871.1 substrate-binding domain-containing protein [Yersinia intermedia]